MELNLVSQYNSYNGEIGINICRTGDTSTHCGLLYATRNGTCKFLHLAFHAYLKDDDIDVNDLKDYRWVKLAIDEYLYDTVAEWCELIKNKGEKIPYGLYHSKTTFNNDGILVLGKNEYGLSCSTFVIAVLERAGIILLQLEDWTSRPDDEHAHQTLINMLQDHQIQFSISDEHINNVKSEIGCIRYRPEEVAAASVIKNKPANFVETSELGSYILQSLP